MNTASICVDLLLARCANQPLDRRDVIAALVRAAEHVLDDIDRIGVPSEMSIKRLNRAVEAMNHVRAD